jgi:hypothetical protein
MSITPETISKLLVILPLLFVFVYWIGIAQGKGKALQDHTPELERGQRYIQAVCDFKLWCSSVHPMCRQISTHLIAVGEGESLNAGTPAADEACTVQGLRQQLSWLLSSVPYTTTRQIKDILSQLRTDITPPNNTLLFQEEILEHIDTTLEQIDKILPA